MDINTLKTLINAYIRKNGVQAITGDILNGVLLKMADYTTEGDAQLQQGIRDVTDLVDRETGRAIAAEEVIQASVLAEVQRATLAEEALGRDLGLEILNREEQGTALQNDLLAETERATSAESELSARIDTIVQGRNVRDIVANYDELLAYDTSTLGDNDIIMVLLDATKSGHTTYYRWNLVMREWEFIGGLAFTYTKTEIDQKFAALHIVLPTFGAESSQEILAQVDTMVRSAGADASFKVSVDDLTGNVSVTYVRTNPANTYIGVMADDRSVLYHITRTISQPRTYTCEVITKTFVEVSDFESEVTRIEAEIATKQPALVSGENIKTINGNSLLGAGDLEIEGGAKAFNIFARAMADLNVSAPLLDRETANGETIKEDSIAVVKSIKGKSLVWNQLNNAANVTRSLNGLSIVIRENKMTLSGTVTASFNYVISYSVHIIGGHKYLLIDESVDYPFTRDNQAAVQVYLQDVINIATTENLPYKYSFGSAQSDGTALLRHRFQSGTTYDIDGYIQFIDLTQMFGAGNEPTTYEEFLARKPKVADEYAYDEGHIVNTHAEGIMSNDADGNVLDALDLSWIKDIKDEDGNLLFPAGELRSDSTAYDEVTPAKAFKRVDNDGVALANPIEVTFEEKQAFYAVANGGRESLITEESTPADTIIGYKK